MQSRYKVIDLMRTYYSVNTLKEAKECQRKLVASGIDAYITKLDTRVNDYYIISWPDEVEE